jgi:hypothetical protein
MTPDPQDFVGKFNLYFETDHPELFLMLDGWGDTNFRGIYTACTSQTEPLQPSLSLSVTLDGQGRIEGPAWTSPASEDPIKSIIFGPTKYYDHEGGRRGLYAALALG